jgi:hypothetical protein
MNTQLVLLENMTDLEKFKHICKLYLHNFVLISSEDNSINIHYYSSPVYSNTTVFIGRYTSSLDTKLYKYVFIPCVVDIDNKFIKY